MRWVEQIDGYCERLDLTFWAEPLNAATNLAFILAAFVMLGRTRDIMAAKHLCYILFAIGVGSFLFHTTATTWAALADTFPIGLFILVYLFLINRDVVGWPTWAATLGTAMFVPYAVLVVPMINQSSFLAISNFYWSIPLLLGLYSAVLFRRAPQAARGLLLGAAILAVSITIRSLDEILCPYWPVGTHFLWHCLNAVMLGFMIHVYHAHVLAGRRSAG